VLLTCAFCAVLLILIGEYRLDRKVKRTFSLTAVMVFFAALCEWGGIFLNGAPENTKFLHALIKAGDYIFTPLIPYFMTRRFADRKYLVTASGAVIAANTLLQIVSVFTGWTFFIGADNHYAHGRLYPVYMIVYALVYVALVVSFFDYCKHFKRRNLPSLISTFGMILMAVLLQEIFGDTCRIAYLAISGGLTFLFLHYIAFYQQRNEEFMTEQDRLLRTDPLTQMQNRFAYNELLGEFRGEPDGNVTIFSVDINRLKRINDESGHEAGDRLIRGAALAIDEVFSPFGKCFRTGGDEFFCVLELPGHNERALTEALRKATETMPGMPKPGLFLSVGYARASEHRGMGIGELIAVADHAMYREKERFYEEHPELKR
ncbi:MAG: GGDEF domain-containing protein, partial [Clostridia bacterium]|nr:GGDEF domain-containing protein [Clostridia bacterium]